MIGMLRSAILLLRRLIHTKPSRHIYDAAGQLQSIEITESAANVLSVF